MTEPHRRSGDIDPAVELFVEKALKDTRHEIRGDLGVLSTTVAAAQATSTKEHSEVKARLDAVLMQMTGLQKLEPRVAALEKAQAEESAAASAVDKLRRSQRWYLMFFVGAVPVAVLAAPHIH